MSACEYLKSTGWNEYPDMIHKEKRCWYKRFDTPTRCASNDEKPGAQVCISVSEWSYRHECYEMELSGQLPDGTWIKLHNWSMPEAIEAGVAMIPRLLATWEFIANQPLT